MQSPLNKQEQPTCFCFSFIIALGNLSFIHFEWLYTRIKLVCFYKCLINSRTIPRYNELRWLWKKSCQVTMISQLRSRITIGLHHCFLNPRNINFFQNLARIVGDDSCLAGTFVALPSSVLLRQASSVHVQVCSSSAPRSVEGDYLRW